jgi:hypothetical protein
MLSTGAIAPGPLPLQNTSVKPTGVAGPRPLIPLVPSALSMFSVLEKVKMQINFKCLSIAYSWCLSSLKTSLLIVILHGCDNSNLSPLQGSKANHIERVRYCQNQHLHLKIVLPSNVAVFTRKLLGSFLCLFQMCCHRAEGLLCPVHQPLREACFLLVSGFSM